MGKGSAPAAPDPYASAGAQAQYGEQAAAFNAALNRVNQTGPTSSTQYAVTGNDPQTGAPIYSQNTQLSAPEQALLVQREATTGEAGSAAQAGIANNPLPTVGQNQDFGAAARQAAYGFDTSTLDPYWNEQHRQMDSSLRNSGATPGTPAYDNAMTQFNAQRNTAYSQARDQAFSQGLAAQGQQISQIGQLQQIPLNEYLGLSTGSQVGTGGQPSQVAGTSAPDIMAAFQNQYQGQLSQYNSNVASQNADVGALAAIIAAAASSSDRRAKKDVKPLGVKTGRGNPLYAYRYNFQSKDTQKQVGVMAQDVEKRNPEAVTKDAKGMRYVNYAKV